MKRALSAKDPVRFEGLDKSFITLNALDEMAALLEAGRRFPAALTATIEPIRTTGTSNGWHPYRITLYFTPDSSPLEDSPEDSSNEAKS